MIITNAKIFTSSNRYGVIERGCLVVRNGKIHQIGSMDESRPDETDEPCCDAAGMWLIPGLIDAHTHLGIIGDSLGFEGDDVNEMTDPATPQLRALDAVNPLDVCFEDAYRAGVTCVVTGPGSANPIGGQMIAVKTHGKCIDDMVIRAPVAIKFALGENPKSVYHGKSAAPETRMATASLIRETLKKALKYKQDLDRAKDDEDVDPPEFDFKSEALLPLLRHEVPAHFHAHRADDILTAVRIAAEFDLDYTIVHGTEAHLIADVLAKRSVHGKPVSVLAGPLLCDRSKPELCNLTPEGPKLLRDAGIAVSIVTDHSVIPIQYLTTCAALAVKYGLGREDALKALTIAPAEILGLDHRIGSLEPGKDADFVLFDRDPLDFYAQVRAVAIDGNWVTGRQGEAQQ